jgi:hypothetical protein
MGLLISILVIVLGREDSIKFIQLCCKGWLTQIVYFGTMNLRHKNHA